MYLKTQEITNIHTNSEFSLEIMADDLILCSIINNIEYYAYPFSYWRLTGNNDVPPLEIGINPTTGILNAITVFITPEFFNEFEIKISPSDEKTIIFDTSIFKKTYDFVDVEKTYKLKLEKNSLQCIFENYSNDVNYISNKDIVYMINENKELCGFCLNNLEKTHMDCFEKILSKS